MEDSKPNTVVSTAPPIDNLGNWNLVVGDSSPEEQLKKLVMAWAKDAATGEARYILELDSLHVGAGCGCVCYSCGLPLVAVNAAKQKFIVRPHFRHPDGAEKNDCMVLAARAAALALLRDENRVTLPAKRFGAQVVGLSGKHYEAWVTKPREVVQLKDAFLRDSVSAVLMLDDGREVLVRLTGTGTLDEGETRPIIEVSVDDPSLASLPPGDLKKRLHLLVERGTWCGPHWDELEQNELALKLAQDQALSELDFPWKESIPELGENPTRESLLHWLAKEILLREKRLTVPELVYQSRFSNFQEMLGPAARLSLSDVRLEKTMGPIRPDVLAKYLDPADKKTGEILVEITVSNPITADRLERIRGAGIAALEINLGAMGGSLTLGAFTSLLVDEVTAKRWIYHPSLQSRTEIEARFKLFEQEVADASVQQLITKYLQAVEQQADCRVQELGTPFWEAQLREHRSRVALVASRLSQKGFASAASEELTGQRGSLLERLLSIKKNRAIGYRLDSLWGVLNAILCDQTPGSLRWHTLYLTALKTYTPPLAPVHEKKIADWRNRVRTSLEAGEGTFRRSRRHDVFLGLLFPEMRAGLEKSLPGDTPAYAVSSNSAYGGKERAPKSSQQPSKSAAPAHSYEAHSSRSDGLWLTGRELEQWKLQNPEAARAWEASQPRTR